MKIILYGTGTMARYVCDAILSDENSKVQIVGVVENFKDYEEIRGGWLASFPYAVNIYNIRDLIEREYYKMVDAVLVTIHSPEEAELESLRLYSAGIKNIYIVNRIFIDQSLPVLDMDGNLSRFITEGKTVAAAYTFICADKAKKPKLRYLETHVADQCNLKCNACTHFSNIVEKNQIPDLGNFKRDFKRLGELFSSIDVIHLLGGEPLLNRELSKYIKVVRENFPNSCIEVVTNGLLITKISNELIEVMKRFNINFWISLYPPTIQKIDEITEFLDKQEILYKLGEDVEKFDVGLCRGGMEAEDSFYYSCWQRFCKFMRNGKLYLCPIIPMIYESKEFLKISVSKKEFINSGIDIYEDGLDGWKVLECLYRPAPMCRFCAEKKYQVAWTNHPPAKEDWFV